MVLEKEMVYDEENEQDAKIFQIGIAKIIFHI